MKTNSILDYPDGELILICAFGYALGRKTYVVPTIVNTILMEWENLNEHTKRFIKDRIKGDIETGDAGMDMDVKQWDKILNKEI